MAKVIKRTWKNAREYTVALSAEYTVVVCAETIWEGEDLAMDLVENALKQADIEEVDTHITEEHKLFFVDDEFEYKLKVNMVIPVFAMDYTDAWNCAVNHVESITMPDGVELECTEEIDMTLAEDSGFLRKTS